MRFYHPLTFSNGLRIVTMEHYASRRVRPPGRDWYFDWHGPIPYERERVAVNDSGKCDVTQCLKCQGGAVETREVPS